ncbi:MAG: hypothetical protein ACKVU4_01770 [Phycisphaerales bacterium]
MRQATRELILTEARRIAARTRGPLTIGRFCTLTRFSTTQVYYWFPEGWPKVLEHAGLTERAFSRRHTPEHELLAEIDRVAARLGKVPSWSQFRRLRSRQYPLAEFRRCFGPDAIRHYVDWKARRPSPGRLTPDTRRGNLSPAVRKRHAARLRIAPRALLLGRPFSFRGLLHEPVTEAGVVHAAGVLWQEAGLIVIRMSTGYPDCDALIRVPGSPEAWQRIRVEFELRSSNFRTHRHDPAGCDLIVCWEHDWPQCPVEVLALRPLVIAEAPPRSTEEATAM